MDLRILTICTLIFSVAVVASGTDRPTVHIELVGGLIDVDPNPGSLWVTDLSVNQRQPNERVSDPPSLQFNEIRLLAPAGRVEILVGYERESKVTATSSYEDPAIEIWQQRGGAQVEAFDAAASVPGP